MRGTFGTQVTHTSPLRIVCVHSTRPGTIRGSKPSVRVQFGGGKLTFTAKKSSTYPHPPPFQHPVSAQVQQLHAARGASIMGVWRKKRRYRSATGSVRQAVPWYRPPCPGRLHEEPSWHRVLAARRRDAASLGHGCRTEIAQPAHPAPASLVGGAGGGRPGDTRRLPHVGQDRRPAPTPRARGKREHHRPHPQDPDGARRGHPGPELAPQRAARRPAPRASRQTPAQGPQAHKPRRDRPTRHPLATPGPARHQAVHRP